MMRLAGLFFAVGLLGLVPPLAAQEPRFVLPIACALGETCFIQSYPDTDPGAAAKDYRCGSATYNGHKGTDFRLLSTEEVRKGVAILAAAPGRVKGVRNNVQDRLLGQDRSSVKGKECGNGVVVDHGGGWETQYCHMRRGSVRVKPGQTVKTGEPIGLVGYSGATQFAHLHFSVRSNGKTIDPFSRRRLDEGVCGKEKAETLWQPNLTDRLAYRTGELIDLGFTEGAVKSIDLETGKVKAGAPTTTSPAIVFFARLINLRGGDRVRLTLRGPKGALARNEAKPLDRSKAQFVAFSGRKLREKAWPAGLYVGTVQVIRADSIAIQGRATIQLR